MISQKQCLEIKRENETNLTLYSLGSTPIQKGTIKHNKLVTLKHNKLIT